jgi:phage gp29-like protein
MASSIFSRFKSLLVGDDNEQKPTLRGLELRFHQWEPMVPPEIWTWAGITSVQVTHEAGQFQRSAQLGDSLLRDDIVTGLIQTRLLALRGLPFYMCEQDGTVSEDEQLYVDWVTMFPKSTQMEVTFWTLFEGFCIAQNRWDMKTMVPKLQVWHPGNCYWDKAAQHWIVYTRDAGAVRLIGENAPGNGKWVLFKGWIDERPWMAGIIRAIGLLLLIRQTVLPDFMRYAKKFGAPSGLMKMPPMVSEVDDAQRTIDALAQLNGGSIIHIFNDMDFSLLEPKSNSWEVFAKLLEYVDRAMAILILGATDIVSGGEGGSKARAVVQDRPRQDRIENDCDVLTATARTQILHPYYQWNRGIDDLSQVPTPIWDPTPPEDAERNAQTLELRARGVKSAAEALEKLQALIPDLDTEEYARMYQIPLKDRQRGGQAAFASNIMARHERVLRAARPEHAIPGLGKLIQAAKGAKDPADMRKRIIAAYQGMNPDRLARELAAAHVSAQKEALNAVEARLHGDG